MGIKFTTYISHSVTNGLETNYAPDIAQLIKTLGGEVLNEHTILGSFLTKEGRDYFKKSMGDNYPTTFMQKQKIVYATDMKMVDQADVAIFIFTKASFGVGMELERALTRKERGLPEPLIIGTTPKKMHSKLSWMVTGAFINNPQHFFIKYDSKQALLLRLKKILSKRYKI